MTLEPRAYVAPPQEKRGKSTLDKAYAGSGIGVAVVGGVIALVAMAAVILLDYRLDQPVHRVLKLVAAAALGLSVVLKPWIGMLAFPVIAPFLPWIPPVPVPGINALNLLLGTVFVVWAVHRVFSGKPLLRKSRLGLTIGMLIVVIALSVVRGSAFPTGYYYDLSAGVVDAFRAIVMLCVYPVALLMVRGERARRAMTWAVILGFVAEAVATLLLGRNGRGGRATGSLNQSNDLGAFLALYTVLAAALIPAVRNMVGRIMLLGGTVLGAVAIVLTVSRSAIVAVGAGLLYVGLKSSRLLTLTLIVVGLSAPLWAPDYLKDRLLGTSVSTDESDDPELEPSAQLRVDTWRAIMRLVTEHPLDGVGFAGLEYVLPETGESLGVEVKDSSHNTFLRMLGEVGLFGLGLFVFLLWKCWRLAGDAERRARSRFDRQLAVGLGASTLALAISCAFGDRFFNVLVTSSFWVVCAVTEDSMLEPSEAGT